MERKVRTPRMDTVPFYELMLGQISQDLVKTLDATSAENLIYAKTVTKKGSEVGLFLPRDPTREKSLHVGLSAMLDVETAEEWGARAANFMKDLRTANKAGYKLPEFTKDWEGTTSAGPIPYDSLGRLVEIVTFFGKL